MLTALLLSVATAAAPDASSILARADSAANRAKDATMTLSIEVSSGDGAALSRTLKVWQMGADRRMVKFVAPARLRGTGILVAGDGQTFLYTAAYKRVRRIAGKQGGGSWMGTGFSINDLARVRFSPDYTPAIESEDPEGWTLKLVPKDAATHRHAALRIKVRKADDLVASIVTLDGSNKVLRRITASEFTRSGSYTLAHRIEIEDRTSGKSTLARISNVTFDSGLEPGWFTERQLRRAP